VIRSDMENAFAELEKRAKAKGVDIELLTEGGDRFSVSTQKGKTEKFDSSSHFCAGVRVIHDGYQGSAFTESPTVESIVETFGEALENAKFVARGADPSQRVDMYDMSSAATESSGDAAYEMAALFNSSIEGLSVEEKLKRANLLESVALNYDSRISSVPYSGYSESIGDMLLFNSKGVRRSQRRSSVTGYTYALAKQGDDARMSGEQYFTRNAESFDSVQIATHAAQKAIAKLGGQPPKTGRYPVVIEAEVAAEIFGLISGEFTGRAVFEKQSLFGLNLGESIASACLTVTDDPTVAWGIASGLFDSEGASTRKKNLIENGRLKTFLTNSVYARKLKLPHSANASRSARGELGESASNLIVTPGTLSLNDLLKTYPEMIYINHLTGFHAGYNDGSGDFSLPAEGELWRNGERVAPINNFVLAGNIKQLLLGIEALSSRVPPVTGSIVSPDVLVRELSVAGK
jgi:PmbA protein